MQLGLLDATFSTTRRRFSLSQSASLPPCAVLLSPAAHAPPASACRPLARSHVYRYALTAARGTRTSSPERGSTVQQWHTCKIIVDLVAQGAIHLSRARASTCPACSVSLPALQPTAGVCSDYRLQWTLLCLPGVPALPLTSSRSQIQKVATASTVGLSGDKSVIFR
ncbi:hypothetical protein BDZ91DRAFT_293115 [Kalaharituber pfeilii]|nr:hypothetical protein BDZ91DRAFT_293115 [Kalaharituber pfeilii]